MNQLWRKFCQPVLDWWLDLLFPRLCLLCQAPGAWLCRSCLKELGKKPNYVSSRQLVHLRKTSRIFGRRIVGVWYFWDYKDPRVKKIIYAYKFGQVRELSAVFKSLFKRFFLDFREGEAVPIAPNRQRLKARGFDHIYQMLPQDLVSDNVRLQRIKNTSPQTQISNSKERWKNLNKAFKSMIKNRTKSKTIFLVDDILTSGATAAAAAQALISQADRIYLIVLARG